MSDGIFKQSAAHDAATLTAETIQRAAGRKPEDALGQGSGTSEYVDPLTIRDHAGRAALALIQLEATKGP